jgi:hypothetical protein
MGYLRIHCDYCGGTWDVYGRDDWKNNRSRTCPHCQTKIDGQDWNNQIVPAFAAMQDANRELIKTHTGYHAPMFTVDYIEDHYFPNDARETGTAVFNLELQIEDLQKQIEQLTAAVIAGKGDAE